ncbi:MAG: hypothetical protein ACPGTP_04015 [Bacteroidia bacterium]
MNVSVRGAFVLIVLLLITTCVYSLYSGSVVINDSMEYLSLSSNLVEQNTLYAGELDQKLDYRLYSKRTIGYSLFLALQHQNRFLILASQTLMVVLLFFIGLLLLRRLSNTRLGSLIYAVGFALNFTLFFHSTFILSDLLLSVLVTMSVFTFYSINGSNKLNVLGFLWSLALLVKPVLVPSVLLVTVVLTWQYTKTKKLPLSLLFPVLIFIGFSYTNLKNTGQFEYSSISTINLAQYNAKLTIAKKYGYDSAQQFANTIIDKLPSTKAEYANYKTSATELGKSAILENITTYLQVHVLGAIKMILDPGRFELYTFFDETTSDISLTELIFAKNWSKLQSHLKTNPLLFYGFLFLFLVQLLKLLGFMMSFKVTFRDWFTVVLFVYFIGITGPVGAARFFLPLSTLLVVYSAIGWEKGLHSFQKSPKSK